MSPIGVVRLTIQSAHIIPWSRLLGSAPDPFVTVDINGAPEVARTKHLSHEFEPTWMETEFIVVHSLTGTLNLRLYDHHEHRRDALLGEAHFELSQLEDERAHGGHNLAFKKDEKQRGDLLMNLAYYPVTDEAVSEYSPGIVTLKIWEARRLEVCEPWMDDFETMGQICRGYGGAVIYGTRRMRGRNPVWKGTHAFYWPSRGSCMIVVKIMNGEEMVGEVSLSLDDLVEGNRSGVEWWPLSGCVSGDVRLEGAWRGVGGG